MALRRRRRRSKSKLILYTLIVLLCIAALWFVLNKNYLDDSEVIIGNDSLPDVDTHLETGHQGDIEQSTKGEEDSIKPENDSDNINYCGHQNKGLAIYPKLIEFV